MKKITAFVFILFMSCTYQGKDSVKSAMIKKVADSSGGVFRLTDITKFKWDKVYFFQIPASKNFIDNTLNLKYDNYIEFSKPIIFLKDNKVVHYENNDTSVEGISDNEIIINSITDTTKFEVYTPREAIFKGAKKEYNGFTYYEFKSIN